MARDRLFWESPTVLATGSRLGAYDILALIGSGGMGEVYRARDPRLGRDIAIKVLPAATAHEAERRDRFEREARTVAALNHPNIVTIHSVEEADGHIFLTMELVEGCTLTDLIPRGGLSIDRLLKIAVPLADAVAAAHQKGVMHRDLKPANVMVTDDGRVKVLDFGLAKLKEGAAASTVSMPIMALTGEGRIIGTVAYMSPEQAEGRSVDERSDAFSLGVILYELATGERPFKGDTSLSVLSAIVRDTPKSIAELKPSVPRELAQIVRRSLAKDPERRYQSVKDVRNELDDLKQEIESGEHPTIVVSPGRVPQRRGPWVVVIGVLAGLGLVITTYYVTRAGRQATAPPRVAATFTQLTSYPGLEMEPRLSPDGKWILYVAGPAGNLDIFLQSVGGRTPINLTKDSTVDDSQPAFSPDGEHIAFRSERQGGGIFVMGRTGESARRLTDAGYNPTWSPDGTRLAYASESVDRNPYVRGSKKSELWSVDMQTGQSRLLYKGDAVQPEWSPHGLRVAYWATNSPDRNRSYRDIWTIPASGGTAVSVTNDAAVDWNPIWAPDGASLYFASDRGGSMNLWRVAIDEQTGIARGEPEALTAPTRFAGNISVSADGSRLAFASFDQARNIQAIEFDAAGERTRGEPRDVTSGSNSWGAPSVSPDGAWLAFNSLPPPRYDIFVSRTDGTGQLQLTNDGVNLLPVWSPDGARIAFYSSRSGHNQVWTVKRDGSQLKQLTSFDDPAIQPTWAPDGSRMAVSTGDPTGSRVFVFDPRKPLNEQMPEALPPRPKDWLFQPRDWSPDGSRIAGSALSESADMLVYSVASRSYRRIGTGPFGFAKWLRDSRRILYGGTGGTYSRGSGALSLVDTDTKRTREVLSLPHAQIVAFTISADNRTIYFARDSVEGDIWLATFQRGTTAALPSLR